VLRASFARKDQQFPTEQAQKVSRLLALIDANQVGTIQTSFKDKPSRKKKTSCTKKNHLLQPILSRETQQFLFL
jgi:hypothetical protein